MGYDPERIPIVRQAFRCTDYPLAEWGWRDVRLLSNRPEWNDLLPDIADEATFHFEPHFGWKGYIERTGIRDNSTPGQPENPLLEDRDTVTAQHP